MPLPLSIFHRRKTHRYQRWKNEESMYNTKCMHACVVWPGLLFLLFSPSSYYVHLPLPAPLPPYHGCVLFLLFLTTRTILVCAQGFPPSLPAFMPSLRVIPTAWKQKPQSESFRLCGGSRLPLFLSLFSPHVLPFGMSLHISIITARETPQCV